jgi:hypothetical protein
LLVGAAVAMDQVLRSNGSAKSLSRSEELPFSFPGVGNASSSAASKTLSSTASWLAKGWDEGSYDSWKNQGSGKEPRVKDCSFNSRPTVVEDGGEDPPTRLIGNFLREQIASGVELSLDVDLVTEEELGRPALLSSREREARATAHHRSQSSSSDDSDSDDGLEVTRSTPSGAGAGGGPLLRAKSKTRSRLMDPPPHSPRVVDEQRKSSALRPPKSGHQNPFSGRMAGKSGQFPSDEEDDPFVDLDDDDYHHHLKKRGKMGTLTTILQWVSLVLIIGVLLCTLTVKRLAKKKLWELHLWKWELLVFVLICGHLVSGWAIRIAVFCVERNFVLRKRALYFVYGVRGAVQNALWLSLALASWHFVFVQGETSTAVLPHVTKTLLCFLVATLVRLVKTLLLKVLASSFHVSTYFDRIQEALFNQHVIEALSGPELVGEDYVLAEVRELQRAGATIPKELRAGLPPKTLSGQRSNRVSGLISKGKGTKLLSEEKKQREIDEGITIDKLHRLNRKNVSPWNMKRLMKIVRFGTLTTMDEQIQKPTGEIGESATHIRSEYQAQVAAKKIFNNVAKPGSK